MLKYLRTAVTALSLTACVLLTALWVRSYWWRDGIMRAGDSGNFIIVESCYGTLSCSRGNLKQLQSAWRLLSIPADKRNQKYRWHSEVDFLEITVPYWAIVPPFFLLAIFTALWIHWPKRSTLRTLLIATTLVAAGLGIVIAAA